MRLTARQLNRATLGRQLLLRREPLDVVEAVRRIVALQAQEPASPYIALWNRLAGFDPADLDTAFADYSVVKATTLRITLHAVHADDYPTFHNGMVHALRGSRLTDRRYTSTGLSSADADALVPELMRFVAQPRTNADLEDWITTRLGPGTSRVWWALRTLAPLWHAPTGEPWSFRQRPAFVAAGAQLPPERRPESVKRLVWRYLEGFGPASIQDAAQCTVITRSVAREAIDAMAGDLVQLEGPDGARLFDVPGALLPPEETPAPARLLPMWDSVLLAYSDRSRVIPPEYRPIVTRQNGDVLPTMLVDGYVCGVWRPLEGGIEATAFHPLSNEAWNGLAAEASALVAFLADRDPTVYRRYGHWWKTLSSAEVRVLPR